jgi:hypothetical protein
MNLCKEICREFMRYMVSDFRIRTSIKYEIEELNNFVTVKNTSWVYVTNLSDTDDPFYLCLESNDFKDVNIPFPNKVWWEAPLEISLGMEKYIVAYLLMASKVGQKYHFGVSALKKNTVLCIYDKAVLHYIEDVYVEYVKKYNIRHLLEKDSWLEKPINSSPLKHYVVHTSSKKMDFSIHGECLTKEKAYATFPYIRKRIRDRVRWTANTVWLRSALPKDLVLHIKCLISGRRD